MPPAFFYCARKPRTWSYKIGRALGFRAVPAVVKDEQFGACDGPVVGLSCGYRDDAVVLPPDDQCGQTLDPFQEVGQARIVHVRLPGQAGGLGPGIFPGLELVRRFLDAIESGKFRSGRRVVYAGVQICSRSDDEEVQDLSFWRPHASRRDEDHPLEQPRVGCGHFRGNPATEGETDDIHWTDAHLPQHPRVEPGQVADTGDPVCAG